MKINKNFVVRAIGETDGKKSYYAIAVGKAAKDFKGMVKLNETAYEVYEYVKAGLTEEEIVEKMFSIYDAERSVIEENVKTTLATLKSVNAVID